MIHTDFTIVPASEVSTSRFELFEKPIKGYEANLYVVEFIGHGVKVGITGNPPVRMRTHLRDAKAYGREVGRIALTRPHVNARGNERTLIHLGGTSNRSEYIRISFESAVSALSTMTIEKANVEAIEKREAAVFGLFKSMALGSAK